MFQPIETKERDEEDDRHGEFVSEVMKLGRRPEGDSQKQTGHICSWREPNVSRNILKMNVNKLGRAGQKMKRAKKEAKG